MASQVSNPQQARTDRRKRFAETVAILKDDPHDVRARLQVIELLQEEGRHDEAVEEMLRVAANYTRRGVPIKAVAVMRSAVKLRPERAEVRLAYAEVFDKLKMIDDAAREYRAAWDLFLRDGALGHALDTLGMLLAMDPGFVPGHVVYAEALGRAGRTEQAAAVFRKLGEHLLDQGATADWEKVAERAVFFDPHDVTLAHDLALHYVRTHRHAAALSKLIVCYEAEPGDGELVELIVEVLDSLGQHERAAALLRVQVGRYRAAGLAAETQAALERLAALDPDDLDAREAIGATHGAVAADTVLAWTGEGAPPARPARAHTNADEEEFGFGAPALPAARPVPAPSGAATRSAPPPLPADEEDEEGFAALRFDAMDGRPTMRGAAAFESQGFPVDAAPAMVEAPPPAATRPPFATETAPERPSLRRTVSRPTLSRMTTASRPVAPEPEELDATKPLAAVATSDRPSLRLPSRAPPLLRPATAAAASSAPLTGMGVSLDDAEEAGFDGPPDATMVDPSVMAAVRRLGEAPSSAIRSFEDPSGADRQSRPLLNARRRSNSLPRPKLVRAGATEGAGRGIGNDLRTLDFFIDRGFYDSAVALCAELENRHPGSEEISLRRSRIQAMAPRT